MSSTDTIAAIATAPGRGGIGIIRLSGTKARDIGEQIFQHTLKARHAHYGNFFEFSSDKKAPGVLQQNHQLEDTDKNSINKRVLDQGICLFFPGPNSFTGEDVVEFQVHGGPINLDLLLKTCLQHGARLAQPGEFSERAFLNDKLDLTQAEAIADLINSSSEAAARSALQSLQGAFSEEISTLNLKITELRMFVEASIDFPEEEIDFISEGKVAEQLQEIINQVQQVKHKAKQGSLLRDGISIVLAGKPNVGKSSLLNALSGQETAIVTDIAGTTRDVLKEQINIDGLPLHIIDTAGIRETDDIVEMEGVKRAEKAIEKSDHVLLLIDLQAESDPVDSAIKLYNEISTVEKTTIVFNKIDLKTINVEEIFLKIKKIIAKDKNSNDSKTLKNIENNVIAISAKTGSGIEALKEHIKTKVGYHNNQEGQFIARRRHIDAINRAESFLLQGQEQLKGMGAGELLADDLRRSHDALGEITGRLTPDDLLGEIFSSFCIGK